MDAGVMTNARMPNRRSGVAASVVPTQLHAGIVPLRIRVRVHPSDHQGKIAQMWSATGLRHCPRPSQALPRDTPKRTAEVDDERAHAEQAQQRGSLGGADPLTWWE